MKTSTLKAGALRSGASALIVFAAAAAFNIVWAWTSPTVAAAASPAAAASELTIGLLPIEDALPIHVAEAEGLFAKAGVKVNLVPFMSAVERDTALRAGRLDGMVSDLLAALLLEKGGARIAVTSVTLGATPGEGRFAILASPKAPNLRTVADLKKVPIGISHNSIIEFVTDQLLTLNGLKAADISKMEVPKIPIRLEMLLGGQLQAATLPDPLAAYAESRGARVILSDASPSTSGKENLTQVVMIFRRDAVTQREDAITKFYDAYRQAVRLINADPEKYRPLLVQKAQVPASIEKTYPIPRYPQPVLPEKEDFERVVNWALGENLVEKAYSYQEIFDGRFVTK